MKGYDVILIQKTQTGTDPFGNPIYTETQETVKDCLIGQPSSDDVTSSVELYGKKVAYTIGIPKGDTHDWTAGKKVRFFDEDWRIIGMPTLGIEVMIPTTWNTKVQVERYEQG